MNDRWLTFDCFGTLVSWQRGFPQILKRVAGERNEELADAYHRFEAQVEAGTYQPYKSVLRTALRMAAQEIGLDLQDAQYDVLSQHWDEQPVFSDVEPALREAHEAGWKLAALTNCDRDLFARTQNVLPVRFDAVITAEDVRSYKPAHGHFARFAMQTGVSRDQWVHVACSYFHDIAPARELGIKRIWIDRDRTGEDPASASRVQYTLEGLAALAGGLNG
jgi:2-haloacid dehalogenase